MRFLLAAFLGLIAACAWADGISTPSAIAPIGQSLPAVTFPPVASTGGGGGCSQATTVNNALDGGQNSAAITSLICGMVTDGTYSLLQGLNVAATNSVSNFAVNWANPGTFNLTVHSSANCTFTANSGIKGDEANCFFDTGFVPSINGTTWTSTTASLGVCILTQASGTSDIPIGVNDGSNYAYMQPSSGTNFAYDLQGGMFPTANTSTVGGFISTRTTTANITLYFNGVAQAPAADPNGPTITKSMYILAFDNNGTAADFAGTKGAYFFYGGGLTPTNISNIRSRLNTYLTTVSGSSGC